MKSTVLTAFIIILTTLSSFSQQVFPDGIYNTPEAILTQTPSSSVKGRVEMNNCGMLCRSNKKYRPEKFEFLADVYTLKAKSKAGKEIKRNPPIMIVEDNEVYVRESAFMHESLGSQILNLRFFEYKHFVKAVKNQEILVFPLSSYYISNVQVEKKLNVLNSQGVSYPAVAVLNIKANTLHVINTKADMEAFLSDFPEISSAYAQTKGPRKTGTLLYFALEAAKEL